MVDVIPGYTEGRIVENFAVEDFITEAFPEPEEKTALASALIGMAQEGIKIEVGGFGLRKLLGCEKFLDLVNGAKIAEWGMTEHDLIRLTPIIKTLNAFPQDRMAKPDADLFVWKADPEVVAKRMGQAGLEVKVETHTGGVNSVTVKGSRGVATVTPGELSWQTSPPWPPYGFTAPLSPDGIRVNISANRFYCYPLELPGINMYPPDSPRRVAAVGRTLLWEMTQTSPDRCILRMPSISTQIDILETMQFVPEVFLRANVNEEVKKRYGSSLRDLALVLWALAVNVQNNGEFLDSVWSVYEGHKITARAGRGF